MEACTLLIVSPVLIGQLEQRLANLLLYLLFVSYHYCCYDHFTIVFTVLIIAVAVIIFTAFHVLLLYSDVIMNACRL